MVVRLLSLRYSAAVFGALLCAGRAGAQLASLSPFLPAQGAGAATPTAGAPLEFRGSMEDHDGIKLRIVDPARKAGWWVRVNEHNPDVDFTVKQYDSAHDTVVAEQQGKTFTLALRESKVVSSGAAGQGLAMPPPGMPQNMPPAIVNSVAVNPTPAQEQARLEAVAAEVARRRALREQASQQVNQGQAAAVAQQVLQQQQQQQQNAQQNPQGQQNSQQPGQRGQRGQGVQGGFRQRQQ
jgi:hypothetical protein